MHVSPSCLARSETCAPFRSCQGERGGASGKGGGGGGKMLINPPALILSSVRRSSGREGKSGRGRGGGGRRRTGVEGGGKRKRIVPQVATDLPGFPRSRSHSVGVRSRLPSVTAHGEALSPISGSRRGLHNCSKKPNQKANLQASKLHVTLSAGSESCNRITSHAYLFL